MDSGSKILSGDALLEKAQREDWSILWSLLLTHVLKRLRYRYGRREPISELKIEGRKLLSEALSLILVESTRNWNSEHYQSFQEFTVSVIDSHLSNHFAKQRPKETPVETLPEPEPLPSIEDEIVYKELRERAFKILQGLNAKDDELMVFECMADGTTKPKAIRDELGISENDFRNIWRRLEPKLEELRKQIEPL